MTKRFTYHVWTAALGLLLFVGAASPIWTAVCDMETTEMATMDVATKNVATMDVEAMSVSHAECCCDRTDAVINGAPQVAMPLAHANCCCLKQTSPEQPTSQMGVLAPSAPAQHLVGAASVESDLRKVETHTKSRVVDGDNVFPPSRVSIYLLNSTFLN